MFRHDRAHTGRSDFSAAANKGTLKWRFTFSKAKLAEVLSDLASEPVVGSDGTIYAASIEVRHSTHPFSGHLFALNPDGTLKWQFDTADFLSAGQNGETSPAIGANGTIYVGGREINSDIFKREEGGDSNSLGFLYAINPSGSLKWKFATGKKADFSTSPVIGSDGVIYIGSGDGNLFAINPDGNLRWKCAVGQKPCSSPSIGSDGTIYVDSDGDSYLYAVTPGGALKWKFKADGPLTSSATIGPDDTIYVSVFQSSDEQTAKLCAINPNGRLKWKFAAKKAYFTNPAIGADTVVYVYSEDHTLYAVNSNGTLKWRTANIGSKTSGASATIGGDGTIFVGANALDANGMMKWKYDEHLSGTATIGTNGTIYFECGDRADICAIGPPASATQPQH
jgi:outer membrane protein assembly factor BamB